MQSFLAVFDLIVNLLLWIIIIQAVLSWLIAFDVINTRNQFVGSLWRGLNALTEPIYAPIRSVLPPTGGLDFAPLIVIVGLIALQRILYINFGPSFG